MFQKCERLATVILGAAMLTAGCSSSQHASSLPESNETEFRQQLEQPGLVLAKFGAPWCPPCREVDRELATIATDGDLQAEIVMINVDDERNLAREYQVTSIPRLMLFRNGNKIKDHVGFAKRDEIESWIRAASSVKPAEIQLNPLVES